MNQVIILYVLIFFQARNFMRDQMKKGQLAFFYHSNCKNPGIAGIAEVKLYKTYKKWFIRCPTLPELEISFAVTFNAFSCYKEGVPEMLY